MHAVLYSNYIAVLYNLHLRLSALHIWNQILKNYLYIKIIYI